jgi:hypothetical protein
MLHVVMLNVIMLTVVAPMKELAIFKLSSRELLKLTAKCHFAATKEQQVDYFKAYSVVLGCYFNVLFMPIGKVRLDQYILA